MDCSGVGSCSGGARGFGEVAVLFRGLIAQEKSLLFRCLARERVGQLLPPRLNGEVCLAERDDAFRRVGVLHDEVAGVAGEMVVFDLALRSRAERNHLHRTVQMILDALPTITARLFGLLEHGGEFLPAAVFEKFRRLASGPELAIFISVLDGLEG